MIVDFCFPLLPPDMLIRIDRRINIWLDRCLVIIVNYELPSCPLAVLLATK